MTDYIIIEVTPGDDDYNTIPHHQIFARGDFWDERLGEEARPIALVSRNGDRLEYFEGHKDIERDIPNGTIPVSSSIEIQDVTRVARAFLDPTAKYHLPRLILQPV